MNNVPPPPDWIATYETYQNSRTAGRLGPKAARFILQVRAATGQGPTFSELLAHLGTDVFALSDPPATIPRRVRDGLRGRLAHGLLIALSGRGWICWTNETRSLNAGNRFDPSHRSSRTPSH